MGDFREPARLTANLQVGYETSRNTKLTLTFVNLTDSCFQRRYPWDNASTCVYAQLPSNKLAPVGNFVSDSNQIPEQLKYPYGNWFNNSPVGMEGQRVPFNAALDFAIKL